MNKSQIKYEFWIVLSNNIIIRFLLIFFLSFSFIRNPTEDSIYSCQKMLTKYSWKTSNKNFCNIFERCLQKLFDLFQNLARPPVRPFPEMLTCESWDGIQFWLLPKIHWLIDLINKNFQFHTTNNYAKQEQRRKERRTFRILDRRPKVRPIH